MKRFFFTLAATASLIVLAQTDKDSYYGAGSFTHEGITLPYRELALNQEVQGKSCLVVQLHGGTARGDDNKAQLAAAAVDSVEHFLEENRVKAIFVLPQCGSDRVWNENRRTYPVTMTDVVAAWLNDYIALHDIAPDAVFLTGYSAGGSGAWRLTNDQPDMFAAAVIAAANPLMVTDTNVKETPVFAVAGSNDAIMDAEKIKIFAQSLLALGAEVRFDLLEGKDHFGTCDEAFSSERLGWLLGHAKVTTGTTPATGDVNGDGIVNGSDVTALYNILLNDD